MSKVHRFAPSQMLAGPASEQRSVAASEDSPSTEQSASQGPPSEPDQWCKERPRTPEAGVAWGGIVETGAPSHVDPVWFTFKSVIADDRAVIEAKGVDGEWRVLPTHLSRAERLDPDRPNEFILETSVEEALALRLEPNHAIQFRLISPEGCASEPTAPIVVNDPQSWLSRPSTRPMEDRSDQGNRLYMQPQMRNIYNTPASDVTNLLKAELHPRADGGFVLTLPPGSIDPGTVFDTYPPVFADGRGVRSALAYEGSHSTRVNPDGSLRMEIPDDGPVAIRAHHVSYGQRQPIALLAGNRLTSWAEGPLEYLTDKNGRWSNEGFGKAVRLPEIRLNADKTAIVAPPGTLPLATRLTATNASARGLKWAVAQYQHPVELRPDGSFLLPVQNPTFGGLRVGDQLVFVVSSDVSSARDALVYMFKYDGEQLVLQSGPSSLEGTQKYGHDVEPLT
jgi:hypothetical protein